MICEICGIRQAEERHHLFSQTKLNKKLYRDFIHHSENIMYVCSTCHKNKSVPKWNEQEFCKHFGILPRTKSGLQKIKKN
jgi:hypothetical protein